MKNHWLDKHKKKQQLKLMDDALVIYRLVRFSGKFQEASKVRGRIYPWLRKESQDGKPTTATQEEEGS